MKLKLPFNNNFKELKESFVIYKDENDNYCIDCSKCSNNGQCNGAEDCNELLKCLLYQYELSFKNMLNILKF